MLPDLSLKSKIVAQTQAKTFLKSFLIHGISLAISNAFDLTSLKVNSNLSQFFESERSTVRKRGKMHHRYVTF